MASKQKSNNKEGQLLELLRKVLPKTISDPKLLEKVDVVLLESVDGRIHLQEATEVIKAGKPLWIDKPVAEVFEAIVNPAQLSRYFTTGGAKGRLETGAIVSWDFHDFPGAFPVWVVEVEPERRIVLRWEANDGAPSDSDAAARAAVRSRCWAARSSSVGATPTLRIVRG